MKQPTTEQLGALRRFADFYGRRWKSVLRTRWASSGAAVLDPTDAELLRQVRNTLGPSWLVKFRFPPAGERARLDAEGTAEPLTRIVHHPPRGACLGPGMVLHAPEHEAADGKRTPLEASASAALTEAVADINRQFGKGTAAMLDAPSVVEQAAMFSSGSPGIDAATGGGYPRGRIVELYGPSHEKTTLALHAAREIQRSGGAAAYIDMAHSFDITYARAIGLDLSRLLVSQPDSGEQALEIAETLVRSGAVGLVVIDSVDGLAPRAELDGESVDPHNGPHARLMAQALRKLTGIAHRSGTCVMFLNDMRSRCRFAHGNPDTTTGGNALKFYASMRLDVRPVSSVEDDVRIRVNVSKNKLAPPFREATITIRQGHGIVSE